MRSNDIDPKLLEQFKLLPTGKVNVSFSEVKTWHDCPWRHKLQNIDKIDLNKPGIALDFGTSMHAAHEQFINTNQMSPDVFVKMLHELWAEHEKVLPDTFTVDAFKSYAMTGKLILSEVEAFYSEQFPGWKPVAAEYPLFEQIPDYPHAFKGFIDAIISVPHPKHKDKRIYWILDVKTTSWGWPIEKKQDAMIRAQLILYKHFWSHKENVNPRDIKCGFLLFKRIAKPGNRLELFPVSVGDTTTQRAINVVQNMLKIVKRGKFIKNRLSCDFCQYRDTPHCGWV